ncbi:hypothetical protein, partial [Allochromatium palmeri]|uniref:hypothetical protein n=1 Tax=Allochromatium palmeri TaxID=231048 RepID=UPI001CA465C3
ANRGSPRRLDRMHTTKSFKKAYWALGRSVFLSKVQFGFRAGFFFASLWFSCSFDMAWILVPRLEPVGASATADVRHRLTRKPLSVRAGEAGSPSIDPGRGVSSAGFLVSGILTPGDVRMVAKRQA